MTQKLICENLQICKHRTQGKLIPEQIDINTKHVTIFKISTQNYVLNTENTEKPNMYTTHTSNVTNLSYQKSVDSQSNNQSEHKFNKMKN